MMYQVSVNGIKIVEIDHALTRDQCRFNPSVCKKCSWVGIQFYDEVPGGTVPSNYYYE